MHLLSVVLLANPCITAHYEIDAQYFQSDFLDQVVNKGLLLTVDKGGGHIGLETKGCVSAHELKKSKFWGKMECTISLDPDQRLRPLSCVGLIPLVWHRLHFEQFSKEGIRN